MKQSEIIEKMAANIEKMAKENAQFRAETNALVESIQKKTDTKNMPIYLEQDILKAAQIAIGESITKALTGYSSPLQKLVDTVVSEHHTELKKLITDSFETVIRTEDFKKSITNAFSHKVARSVISNNDGLFDKVSNELKQDATFKAKMILAVETVVNECLTK